MNCPDRNENNTMEIIKLTNRRNVFVLDLENIKEFNVLFKNGLIKYENAVFNINTYEKDYKIFYEDY